MVEAHFLHEGKTPPCHRIAVVERNRDAGGRLELSRLISQTDVVRFLISHASEMGPLQHRSLGELGLVYSSDGVSPRGVECVDGATPALDAFGILSARGLSALGVVDDEGKLTANLSPSDLRCVLPDSWGVLARPLRSMLELQCCGGTGKRGLVVCMPDTCLLDAMKRISETKLHHIFVVDSTGAPLAVVSTTDILRLFLRPEKAKGSSSA